MAQNEKQSKTNKNKDFDGEKILASFDDRVPLTPTTTSPPTSSSSRRERTCRFPEKEAGEKNQNIKNCTGGGGRVAKVSQEIGGKKRRHREIQLGQLQLEIVFQHFLLKDRL